MTSTPRGAFAKTGRALYDWLLPACFLALAVYFAATTANVMMQYALRQPAFDQYKEYANYLSQPFLTSVFMLENGHRPVLPALIANIEIVTRHADQSLQLGIGALCIALSIAIIAITGWRHAMPRAARAATVLLAVLGILWLANARMLIQSMGELQIYMVMVFVLLAALATWRAYRLDSSSAMTLASLSCALAMFTFGAGAAAFPTIIALGVWLRLPLRRLAIPAVAWAICLVLYLVVLPGHDDVQHALVLRPIDSAIAAARWLSSPWANAFFGLADPPLQPWLQHSVGDGMANAAKVAVEATRLSWLSLSAIFGVLGFLAFGVRIVWRFWHHAEPSRYETLANGLCIFAVFTAAVIGIGRLEYFDIFPTQPFADRYLAWTCLFWTGLAMLLLDDASRSGNRVAMSAILTWCFILPFLIWPTHKSWAGWTASLYRANERTAAAARSGVLDAELLPNDADAGPSEVLQALDALRAQRLAMFADPGWELMGTTAAKSISPRSGIAIDAQIVAHFEDSLSKRPAARVEGIVRDGMEQARDCQLAIIDDSDRVVGIAQFSFIDHGRIMRLLHKPKRGFDAYIRDYEPDRRYRIAAIQRASHEIVAQFPVAPGN